MEQHHHKKRLFATIGRIMAGLYIPGILLTISFFFIACSDNKEPDSKKKNHSDLPVISSVNTETVRTDSGKIIMKAFAPVFKHFEFKDQTYTEFPLGIRVVTYTIYPEVESSIYADFATYWEGPKLWEARSNVLVQNAKGDMLYTEQLFWDEKSGQIYSDKFCRIATNEGILYGRNGFEADESFQRWKLKNTKGIVKVKDE
jgi:LPS export ABC transporter protein LptC